MNLAIRHITTFCLIFFALYAHAQQFNTDQLSVADGLSQSQVYALLEDHRGNIWMGTQGGGLCSFDGFDFDCIGISDGLLDGYVNCLLLTQDNQLLIGTRKGLASYNGNTFTQIELPNLTSVICLEEDADGNVWIGTNNGLFILNAGAIERRAPEIFDASMVVDDIAFGQDHSVWIASSKGAFHFTGNQWVRYGRNDGLRTDVITSVQVCHDGEVYVGTYGRGLAHWGEGEFHLVLPDAGALVLSMLEDSKGNLWVGTLEGGLWISEVGRDNWRNITEDQGLPTNHIRSLLEDSWGNLWIGTSGAGVARYRGQEFEHVDRNRGLPAKQVYSIAQLSKDHWVLGAGDQGLWHFYPESRDQFEQDTILTSGKVKALAVDRYGRLWAGGEGSGVWVFWADTVLRMGQDQGIQSPFITHLEPQEDGSMLIGTAGGGLSTARPYMKSQIGFTIRTLTRAQGMPDDRILDIVDDAQGRTWFATQSNGLGVLVGDEIIGFNTQQGLTSNAIKSLAIDEYQRLWIGTQDAGLCSIDLTAESLSIAQAPFNDELISKNVYSLLSDAESNLWLGSEKGVTRLTIDGEGTLIEAQHFGPEDGFLGIEATSNAAVKGLDGRLWFGTIDGLNISQTTSEGINELAPSLSISEIRLFYTPLSETHLSSFLGDWNQLTDSLLLTYKQNSIGFEFKGINQARPTGVQYRWRLKGHEDRWSPVSNLQSISYSNLPPGSYLFEVEAVNEDGVWTKIPQRVQFEILRPYWQELWFKLLVGLGILLLLAFFVWLRLQSVKRKGREKNDRLKLENSLLELEQKALRLQMNPHFIFNTLNSIQGLIARRDEKTARLYLSKFSRLMRLNLENSREELVPLDMELEALRYFLELERFTHEDRFEYEIECLVDPEEWMVPPLVIQPFAENAIIHGLLPKDTTGKLLIRCREKLGALEIEICDNGIGRKAAGERNKLRQGHRSTGLQVTQERLDLLRQNGQSRETVIFNDLIGEDGSAAGTSVLILIHQVLENR